jgi:hypothetical protein
MTGNTDTQFNILLVLNSLYCLSHVALCVCVCLCIPPPPRHFLSVCVSPPVISRQRLSKNPPVVARQQFGRNVTVVTNTHATIEELLDGSFSMWPMSYQGK